MNNIVGIYKIENLLNGKIYIGQSTHIRKRIKYHFIKAAFDPKSKEYNTPLHKAIRKYGTDKFQVTILERCLKSDLDAKEIKYIAQYGSFDPITHKGYNLTAGGKSATSVHFLYPKLADITEDLRDTTLSQREIACKYGTSTEMIQGINTGRYWYRDSLIYPIRNFYIKHQISDDGEKIKIIYYGDQSQKSNNRSNNRSDNKYISKCKECGTLILKKCDKNLCAKCKLKLRQTHPPDDFIDQIIKLKRKYLLQKYYKIAPITLNRWLSEADINLTTFLTVKKCSKKHPQIGCYISPTSTTPLSIYKSLQSASRSLGLRAPSMIKKACIEKIEYHGYYWKFLDEF